MAGLNCGISSTVGWPILREGLEAAVAVSDAGTLRAPETLAGLGVHAGASGAASVAGFDAVLTGPGREHRRAHLGLDEESVVVLLNTEGAGGGGQPS